MGGEEQELAGHILGTAGCPPEACDILPVAAQENVHDLLHRTLIQLGIAFLQIVQRILAHVADQAAGAQVLQGAEVLLPGSQIRLSPVDLAGSPGVHLAPEVRISLKAQLADEADHRGVAHPNLLRHRCGSLKSNGAQMGQNIFRNLRVRPGQRHTLNFSYQIFHVSILRLTV